MSCKIVVFCGDFRPVSPVLSGAGGAQIITKTISNSKVSPNFEYLELMFNERINQWKETTEEKRKKEKKVKFLLQIGEDRLPKEESLINVPESLLNSCQTEDEFIDETYCSLSGPTDSEWTRLITT